MKYLEGIRNLFTLQGVVLSCPFPSCSITNNGTRHLKLKANARILGESVYIVAGNANWFSGSVINVMYDTIKSKNAERSNHSSLPQV